MPGSKEPEVRKLALKIARIIEEKYEVPPEICEIYAALELFARYNPGADPEAIDWSIWDPRLPLEAVLERLEKAYPGYAWRPPSPPMDKAVRRGSAIRPEPRPTRLGPRNPEIPPLGIAGAGGCARGYSYHKRYASRPRHEEPMLDSPVRRERPRRGVAIWGIPLLPRSWRDAPPILFKILLLMLAIPVFLLFTAFSRD
jgi:hypothetical protein